MHESLINNSIKLQSQIFNHQNDFFWIEKDQTLFNVGLPVQVKPQWLFVPGHLHIKKSSEDGCSTVILYGKP